MIGNLSKHKRNNDDTYKRSEIDLIVSNAKKSAIKYAEELAEKKLDKDENKGLSTNDYTDAEKAEVAKIKDKVDKVSGKGLSANDYTNAEKAEVAKVKDKVDKVSGKGLSTNDFTSAYKTKIDNLDTNLNKKVDKVTGKGLSKNDFTDDYKTKIDNLDTNLNIKVDKVTGKGLSKNDFTDDYKAKLDNLDTNISETLAGKADKTEVLTKTNTTAFTPTADYQPATKKYVDDLASNKGGGDMLKSAYDANKDGVVNDSDKLGGQLPSYYAQASDLTNKVDKVSGKGLSTNDFTSAYKTKLDNLDTSLSGKVDKVSGKGLSANDYTNAEKAEVAKVKDKVDKVTGKGLSTNDFTDNYKTKLDNLDTNLSAKANASAVLTKTNTTAFTPTADYQPATKKYVDDLATGGTGVSVVDNLMSTSTTSALSANQGKILKDTKVDKASGKGLSTNDFTVAYKAKLDNLDTNLSGKVDKVTGKGLSANDYTDEEKAEVAKVKDKVDKVSGKGLSTNDFTDSYKTKLDNLDTNTVETRSIDTVVINSTDWVELQDVLIKTKVLWNSGGSFESDLPGFSSPSTGYWIMSMYMGEAQGANGEVSYAFVQYVSGYDKRVELNADFVGGEVFARSLEISTNSSFADVNSRTVSGYSKWTCINPKTSSSNTVSLCQWHNGEFLGLGKFEGISSATAYSVTIPAGVSLVKITYGSHVPGDGNGTWNYNMVALRKNGTMIGFGGDYQGRYQYGVLGNSLNAQIVSVTSGDVLVLHSSDVKADNLLSYDPDKINEKFTTMPTACVPYCTMIVEAIE